MKQPEEARVSFRTRNNRHGLHFALRSWTATDCPVSCTFADCATHARFVLSLSRSVPILQELLRADRLAKQDPRPHVWKMRTEPPPQFKAWTIGEASNDAQAAAAAGKM
jgi:hypothetical protein